MISGHSYSIDGLLIYRQALAIVQNFSLQFAVPVFWGHSWPTSISGIGLALLYVPSVFVLAKLGLNAPIPAPTPGDWYLFYRDPVYAIGASPVHVLIAVATGFVVLRFVRTLGYDWRTALLAFASYGIASPALVYSRGDFPQPAFGLWLVTGLYAAETYRASRRAYALWLAAAALILAVLTRQAEGSLLAPALLFMFVPDVRPSQWTRDTVKDVVVVMGAYAVAVLITLAVNWGRFGSFLQTGGYGFSWTTPPWIGIPGDLISPARGILWQFPLMLLAPLGVRRLWLTPHRRIAVVMVGVIGVLFLNTALWAAWWGGWNWGARLFFPAWPLLAILAAIGAMSLRRPMRVWLTAILFLAGVLWAFPGSITDLLAGYGGAYDGTANSFLLSGYPPLGAWQFVHHLRAGDLADSSGIDIVWFRIARQTHSVSLVVPAFLVIVAAIFARMAWRASVPFRRTAVVARLDRSQDLATPRG